MTYVLDQFLFPLVPLFHLFLHIRQFFLTQNKELSLAFICHRLPLNLELFLLISSLGNLVSAALVIVFIAPPLS